MKISISPGSMGVAQLAMDLFGLVRTDAGTWGSPVRVIALSEKEVDFAKEFFAEYNCKIEVSEDRTMIKLIPGLTNPKVPLNPNGIGYCPQCGAHAPLTEQVCKASDCENIANQRKQKSK